MYSVSRERNLPLAGRRVFRIVDRFQHLRLAFGKIVDHHLHRPQHRHPPRGPAIQIFPHRIFQHRHVDRAVELRHADPVAKQPDRFGRVAAPPQPANRRHPRIVPTGHVLVVHQFQQPPLAHHGVREIEPREFDLLRMDDRLLRLPLGEGRVEGLAR